MAMKEEAKIEMATPRFKIVLLGDASVGKTSLLTRLLGKEPTFVEPTISGSWATYHAEIEGRAADFEIWDTAGQEKMRSISKIYYRGAKAAILVFDVTRPDSFGGVKYYCESLKENTQDQYEVCIVGNKCDLEDLKDEKLCEEASGFASENDAEYFEVSAQTGANVFEMMTCVAEKVMSSQSHVINLLEPAPGQKERKCCP